MEKKINPNLLRLAELTHNPNLKTPDSNELFNGKPIISPAPLSVNAKINLSDYVNIGINGLYGSPVLISKFEMQGYNNLNYEKTHFKLLENGLYMPSPEIFMAHFNNVMNAYNRKSKLVDGNGDEINGNELDDIYKHLTKNHIASYGESDKAGAWTWLNSKFNIQKNKVGMIEMIKGIDQKGNLISITSPLEDCLKEDCFAELKFNSQGLAVEKSKKQKYLQGDNIYFWYPKNGAVAWFSAASDWALLVCNGDPGYSSSSLGVFACAEGTVQKNLGV